MKTFKELNNDNDNSNTNSSNNNDKALHPRDDVNRLSVSRMEGGRWFACIEDSVDASIQRHEN